jgi:hypothetical protein
VIHPKPLRFRVIRRSALVGIAVLGVLSIVGSGGGVPDFSCFDYGPGCIGSGPIPPNINIDPQRVTVQVGTSATFTAYASSFTVPSSYVLQWCRQPKGADACTAITGATGKTYTLTAPNLGDDGMRVGVSITDVNGAAQALATVAVSSSPGVVHADGDFADASWGATAVTSPTSGGPTHNESRVPTGGVPDAYRSITYLLPQAPSSIRVFHTWLTSTYDPAAQGAIYVIDFALWCARLSMDGANQVPFAAPMIEQGGRRFVPVPAAYQGGWLCGPQWSSLTTAASVAANEFMLADGPACDAGETCPDFSAQGAPLRFGFQTSVDIGPGYSTGSIVQGVDNWMATVWRR